MGAGRMGCRVSLFALLATGAGVPVGTDALAGIRPETFATTYEVGSGQTYATIADALAAAAADHNAWVGSSIVQTAQTNPYRWRRIRVHPGTYNEGAIAPLSHTAIVGATGDPSDVVVTWAGASNVLVATGRSIYVAHMTLDHTDPDPEWHPIRNSGSSGDVGMMGWQHRTGIFENLRLVTAFDGEAGKCSIDTTPGPRCHLIYKGVWFDAPGQPQSVNMSVAQPGGAVEEVSRTWFIDCKVTSNYGWTEDPTLPNWGYSDPERTIPNLPAPVGLPDKGNAQPGGVGRADELYWIGGEWDIGEHITPIQGLIVIPNADAGDNAVYTIDPHLPEGIAGAPSAVKISNPWQLTRARAALDFPIANGISEDEAAFYGPNPDAAEPVTTVPASGTPTTSVTVPAGRVFWVAVDTPEVMIRAGKVGVATTSGGGNVAVATALPVAGSPGSIESDGSGRRSTGATAVVAGQQDVTLPARWYYPGYGRVWVGVAFSAEATLAGWSSKATPGLDVLYADGWDGSAPLDPAGAATLADGQPIPAVWIVNTA